MLCLGIDHDIEHEGIDRTSINLPGIQVRRPSGRRVAARGVRSEVSSRRVPPAPTPMQEEFAEAVVKAANGKPVVLVLVNGGALGIEKLTALDGGAAAGRRRWRAAQRRTASLSFTPPPPLYRHPRHCRDFLPLAPWRRGHCAQPLWRIQQVGGSGTEVWHAWPPTLRLDVMVTVLYLHRVRARARRWGKMPITTYKSDFINECGLTDMNMPPSPKVHLQRRRALPLVSPSMRPAVPTRGPFRRLASPQCLGRTYRYYTGEPLWPFGFGLSYTDFNLTCSTSGSAVRCSRRGSADALCIACARVSAGSATVI